MRINDNGTDRDMTDAEETAHLATLADIEKGNKAQAKVVADKATAKASVIAKLGLTADEVTALLG